LLGEVAFLMDRDMDTGCRGRVNLQVGWEVEVDVDYLL
jgi:hypothetical protein